MMADDADSAMRALLRVTDRETVIRLVNDLLALISRDRPSNGAAFMAAAIAAGYCASLGGASPAVQVSLEAAVPELMRWGASLHDTETA